MNFNRTVSNIFVDKLLQPMDINTFIGGYFENGAWPWANSSAVIPNDQISALSNTYAPQQWEKIWSINIKLKDVVQSIGEKGQWKNCSPTETM